MQAWGAELTEEDLKILEHNFKLAMVLKKGKNEFTKREANEIVRKLRRILKWAHDVEMMNVAMSTAMLGAHLIVDIKNGWPVSMSAPDWGQNADGDVTLGEAVFPGTKANAAGQGAAKPYPAPAGSQEDRT